MGFIEEWIRDNKEYYDNFGLWMLFTVYIKLFFYIILLPSLLLLLLWTGHWIIAIFYSPIPFLSLGVAFGGRNFMEWLSQKFINFRNWLAK